MDSVKAGFSAALIVLVLAAGGAYWYYQYGRGAAEPVNADELIDGDWLEHLYSQNPKIAEEAARQLAELGPEALPEIRATLNDPGADTAMKKAALKASSLLGPVAAAAVPDVAVHLPDPELTEEAAVALSFMGREAYAPLRQGTSSDDPVVRRESLRSLGKLRDRAPLDGRAVVPLLLQGLTDTDSGVRTVAATYLGIIHEDGAAAVPALIETLEDEVPEVRAAAATALGSFEGQAAVAIPALKKAASDRNEDVAREAGLAIVKLQSSSRK
jgi:HEAT repeat protein